MPIPDTLLEYPCEFPLKVMGRGESGFPKAVAAIVGRHAPGFDPAGMESRSSRGGAYLSLTCTIMATSREQLDALYTELCNHPLVVMVL